VWRSGPGFVRSERYPDAAALASAALGYEDGGDAFMANAAQTTLTGGVGL